MLEYYENGTVQLFDLEKDPLEVLNVYDDPAYADVVKTMTDKLNAEMLRIGDVPVHTC